MEISEIAAGAALAISVYNLWQSLKRAKLKVFVPPVVGYSSPYQNSNFEVFEVPVTLVNEGARAGIVLAIDLEVTDPRTRVTKRFYAADFGRWTMTRTRSGAYEPFAPISVPGNASTPKTVLFYTRGPEEPNEIVREPGPYDFRLTLDDGRGASRRPSVTFTRALRFYDARAFQEGTLAMYAPDWRTSVND